MAEPSTWIALASLAVSAAGAGASYYQSSSAAKTQEQFARYNRMIEETNASLNQRMMMAQADAQRRALEAQAAVQGANANMLRGMADAQTGQDRENIRRTREDHLRFQAIQRAKIAKSGVIEEGSPLEILADTAGLMELTISDMQYESNINRTKTMWQADLEQAGAGATLMSAGQTRLDQIGAKVGYRTSMNQARINEMGGLSSAKGTRRQATATLISGAPDRIDQGNTVYQGFSR